MAYSPDTSAATRTVPSGVKTYVWTFTTAEGAAASETELTGAPPVGYIHRVNQQHVSGSAANHQPQIAIVTGGANTKLPYQASSTAVATDIDDPGASNRPIPYSLDSGSSLFYRCVPDAGADNVFRVRVVVSERP